MPATEHQRLVYRDRFRSLHNNEFQAWFETLARAMHPSGDFQAIRLTSGDGGLDGFVINSQLIYQVFAPASIGELRDAEVARKIKSDFPTASETLGGKLKRWVFVHNHPEAKIGQRTAAAINELKSANASVEFLVLDIHSLWQQLECLPDPVLENLLGPASPQSHTSAPHEGLSKSSVLHAVLGSGISLVATVSVSVDSASHTARRTPQPAEVAPRFLESALESQIARQDIEAKEVAPRSTSEPPPLPSPHVSRAAALNALAHELVPGGIAAVFGYAKSGKTTLVAEFIRDYPGAGIWLSVQRTSSSGNDWWPIAMVELALRLGISGGEGPAVRDALLAQSQQTPLVIAIDDAHLLADLDGMVWIEQAVAASKARIALVLAGVDEPSFVERVRSRGIASWRIPGFTQSECHDWFSVAVGEPTGDQRTALNELCARTAGHPGFLRLCAKSIQQISKAEQVERFIADLRTGLGTGPDAFHATLFQAFTEHLSATEFELCRRLSVAFHGFSRRLAESLWEHGNDAMTFAAVWDRCLLRVLDPVDHLRHQLPVLYREGLRQRTTPSEQEAWHAIAHVILSSPLDGTLDIVDAGDSVEHAVCANDTASAINLATRFLFAIRGRYRREASRILIDRFEGLFSQRLPLAQLDWPIVVRWHAARTNTYRELKQTRRALEAGDDLYVALTRDGNDALSAAGQLGWSILMVNAVVSGNTTWASMAAAQLAHTMTAEWRRLGVLFAYLHSSSPPADGIQFVLQDADGGALYLWNAEFGFDLWRSIGMSFCTFLEQNGDTESVTSACAVLRDVATAARRTKELDVSRMALAALGRIQIDYARDFDAALATASELSEYDQSSNQDVAAFCYHAVGNARRCAAQEDAVESYRSALNQWPNARTAERGESLLMLSICLARLGNYQAAYGAALDAAALYSAIDSTWSGINAAHGYFEAATVALRGQLGSTKALRPLIRAYAALSENHPGSPEWVILAQLAMQLSSRLENRSTDIEHPLPGFTIGIRQSDAGSGMNPSAPALLLGRACTLAGLPHRALHYFDEATRNCEQPVTSWGLSVYAMDAAIDARDVPRATTYCAMLAQSLEAEPELFSEHNGADFVQYQISRVVSLTIAVADTSAADFVSHAANAFASASSVSSHASEALLAALAALGTCFNSGSDKQLDEAVATALKHKNIRVVRDLAWYWCFRFAVGRPITHGEYLKWHWRLLWASIEVSGSDSSFLSAFRDQLQGWWKHLARSAPEVDFTAAIRDSLASQGDAIECLLRTRTLLTEVLAKDAGIHTSCLAVSEVVKALTDISWLEPLHRHAVGGVFQLILSPIANEHLDLIDADIRQMEQAFPSGYKSAACDALAADVQALRHLLGNLQQQTVQPNTTSSLLRFETLVPAMEMESSAANYYVWLRHTLNSEPLNHGRLAQIHALLASDHVADLIRSATMPTYLRNRLAEVHYAAAMYLAMGRLMQAVALQATQSQYGFTVSVTARRSTAEEYEAALAAASTALNDLDKLAAEVRGADKPVELARTLVESGGGRKLLGGVLLRTPDGIVPGWQLIRDADRDLREAISVLRAASDHEAMLLRLRAAFERLSVASALKVESSVEELEELIDLYRGTPEFHSEVASLAQLHARDVLQGPQESDPQNTAPMLEDEAQIQDFTDLNMKAMGLPEVRRAYVEDDVRKLAKSMEIQRRYCRHLQPLQNLEHTNSPETAYTRLTKYTCECMLLGYRTQIETDDIDVAIVAMQRNYCDGCSKREPLEATPP